MVLNRRLVLLDMLKLFDLLVAVLAFLVATFQVHYRGAGFSVGYLLQARASAWDCLLFLAFLYLWNFVFFASGLYDSRRLSPRKAQVVDLVRATLVGTAILLAGDHLLQTGVVSPAFAAWFWIVSTGVVVLFWIVLRGALETIRLGGRNLRHLLIVGANPRTVQFVHRIENHPELGYLLEGFVDDPWEGMDAFTSSGYKCIAGLGEFSDVLRERVVDEVVIGLPVKSRYLEASRIVEECERLGIIVRLLSDLFDLRVAPSRSDRFEDQLVITISRSKIAGTPVALKRLVDVAASASLLLLFAPLLLAISLAIKLTTPGPVFFTQERVGLNGRRFKVMKFRTMVEDAEQRMAQLEHLNEVDGPAFKIRRDPRVTPLGRFLRRSSLDELPQLLNVLRGEMSLVGPRPLPIRDYVRFKEDWHRRRFSVRPGITCLWQVRGRHTISFDQWMQLDMQYIDEWSLLLDFKIMFLTVPAVLRQSGAS